MLNFQQIIRKLIDFWEEQGCVVQQGHDIEVGAGTFNPATFLRCLGPEPFNTVYVEPSRRPQDGRFGKNPNRTQLFHQIQVVMKPSPKNIQEIYLRSLEAIALDLKEHDVRFVHDDWESPTLGAWGLGWEVWLDGMEITQFTYFQSIAGCVLKPISVEITYGVERLCMMVQNKSNFFNMQYNEHLSYGDIYFDNEVEWSHYNIHKATTKMWLQHFEDFEHEAQITVKCNLPIPAYDFVIKASHAFNMIEARGILSVTERTGYITRIRNLAKLVASKYLESRQRLGFPLAPSRHTTPSSQIFDELPDIFDPEDRDDFLLEIGSEELPATFVPIGCQHLKSAIHTLLKGFSYHSLTTFGTSRRLVLFVKGLVHGSKTNIVHYKGPPLSVAFDDQGKLTTQGRGFFRSLNLEPVLTLDDIQKHDRYFLQKKKGREYLMASVKKKGISTFHLLHQSLPQIIANLHFPKKMHWSTVETSYARPLKWYVALFGSRIVPFVLAEIFSGRVSQGHAQLSNHSFVIQTASDYITTCLENHVMVRIEDRKQSIEKQLSKIEKETQTKVVEKERVMSQVLFLSEWPYLTYASFKRQFLQAPHELLIEEMVQHQKYFPLLDAKGKLAPLFIITADNKPNEVIKRGNRNVLSARLADGLFLFRQDLKSSLSVFSKNLERMIFHKDLGTVAEKVSRLKDLACTLSAILNLGEETKVLRAAKLCKADLATELVQEFPNLQGKIGKYYALHQKEDKEVALAIEEHWLPQFEQDNLPTSPLGIILSLADKLDNLINYFRVGLIPTSSKDPYALRRQTLGIIKILIKHRLNIDLAPLVNNRVILEFITLRAQGIFEEYGFQKDDIAASLQGICTNPYDQYLKIQALCVFRKTIYFSDLLEVYKRAKGQIGKESNHCLHPHLFIESAEKALYDALLAIKTPFATSLSQQDYSNAFGYLSKLQSPLSALFEQVKILVDNFQIRSNRIALLQEVLSYFSKILDFDKIQNIK